MCNQAKYGNWVRSAVKQYKTRFEVLFLVVNRRTDRTSYTDARKHTQATRIHEVITGNFCLLLDCNWGTTFSAVFKLAPSNSALPFSQFCPFLLVGIKQIEYHLQVLHHCLSIIQNLIGLTCKIDLFMNHIFTFPLKYNQWILLFFPDA